MNFKSFYAEGAGNAFVLLEGTRLAGREEDARKLHDFADSAQAGELAQRLAREADAEGRVCDGLLFALPPRDPESDLRFVVWNRDGSRAGACGNGLRCVARRAFRVRGFEQGELVIECDRGLRRARLGRAMAGARAGQIYVEIGEARVKAAREVELTSGEAFLVHSVDVGNPQAVVLTSVEPDAGIARLSPAQRALREDRGRLLAKMGPGLQNALPGCPNIAIGALDGRAASLRVYERGVGETRSCGTGAVALAAVGHALGLVTGSLRVVQRGGTLEVRRTGAIWWLSGPTHVEEFRKPLLPTEPEFLRAKPAILG